MADVFPPAASSDSLQDTLSSLSKEEIKKLSTHMKDPKFMELLADYAKEIADPKAKAEQDLYLRQLEREGRSQEACRKGSQLVLPEVGFVAKTANKQSGQKIFINVCTSEKVAVATSKRRQDAKAGLVWSVPLLLGPCKEGEDRHKIQCMVFDFIIHPDTCRMAMNSARFKALIVNTAADNVEKATEWTLTRQFSYPKLAFKATEGCSRPRVISVRIDPDGVATQAAGAPQHTSLQHGEQSKSESIQSSQPIISEVATSSNSHANQSAAKASGFKFPSPKSQRGGHTKQPQSQRDSLADASNLMTSVSGRHNSSSGAVNSSQDPLMTALTEASTSKAGASSSSNASDDSAMTAVATTRMQPVALSSSSGLAASGGGNSGAQPKYELVYRGQVDLGDAWEGPGRNNVLTKYPKELVVRVKLPGLTHTSQAQLDVTSQQLTVSVPGKYFLQLNLPYAVADTEGRASFNPAKQQLDISLPVVPPKNQLTALQSQQQQQPAVTASAASDNAQSSTSSDSEQQPAALNSSYPDSAKATAQEASGWQPVVSTQPAENCSSLENSQGGAAAVEEGGRHETRVKQQPQLTDNQQRWQQLHQPAVPATTATSDAEPVGESEVMSAIQQAADAGQEFITCTRCVQHLPGYVFAKRDVGLGYHRNCGLDSSGSNADDLRQRAQHSSITQSNRVQLQPQAPATKYLLRPRLVSLASAEELD